MSTFVLIPGAGGVGWYWHRVVPLLEKAGHVAHAVELPGDDPKAGLEAYADRVVRAVGDARDVVLVAQSLGGFTAPVVCARSPVTALVFVNAMIPAPGETAGQWWGHTGAEEARKEAAVANGYSPEFDLFTYFLHDVPEDVARAGEKEQRAEAKVVFGDVCRFESWPDVPTHVIAGTEDRFFPLDFQKRVAKERLKRSVHEVRGGHLMALSNPEELVTQLLALTPK